MSSHPLLDLSQAEIRQAAGLVRKLHQSQELVFKAITLQEPPKNLVLKYLKAQEEAESLPNVPRIAFAAYYIKNTNIFITTHVNLTSGIIERTEMVGDKFHGNADFKEVCHVEEMILKEPSVLAEIEKLKLPGHLKVVAEGWGFGFDGIDGHKRQFQVYMYVGEKDNPDSNHYARPLAFSPVVDAVTMKMIRIDHIPTDASHNTKDTEPWRFVEPNEYIPESLKLRQDLKPLQVVQPEGTSYSIDSENTIKWQKWQFRLSFNYREGAYLRDVRYDGQPLFYRISLSEMTVPYGDPRSPYHRKQPLDLGDVGAGLVANNLKLGCDCLGSITYMDGLVVDPDGEPLVKENAICLHEQDNGIGWKHSNYRTERPCVVRNREFVVQQILAVSNYEYILAYIFNQAGELHYEVRATGILSTSAMDHRLSAPWGTIVHDSVLAQHHQHIMSLRIDPAIGSYDDGNQLAYSECHAMPWDKANNPYGNGFVSKTKVIDKSGGYDLDPWKNRVFIMQNSERKNSVNQMPLAYKIQAPPMQPTIAHPESYVHRRAEFGDHNIFVTTYQDHELFCAGDHTNQGQGGEGIKTWAGRNDSVVNNDIVVWVQFGMTHVPRIEDFPVMPSEVLKVMLKPYNFFTKCPSLDVPPSTQQSNQSQLVARDGPAVCCMNGSQTNGHH